jgi:hypothetical protein
LLNLDTVKIKVGMLNRVKLYLDRGQN